SAARPRVQDRRDGGAESQNCRNIPGEFAPPDCLSGCTHQRCQAGSEELLRLSFGSGSQSDIREGWLYRFEMNGEKEEPTLPSSPFWPSFLFSRARPCRLRVSQPLRRARGTGFRDPRGDPSLRRV